MFARWPWLTTAAAAIVLFNPVGLGFVRAAFFSNEQLSRNIARPIVLIAAGTLIAAGAVEWWIRMRAR